MSNHRPWRSDWPVTVELVQALVETWFPALALAPGVLVGEGWDNVVVAFEDWLVRVPRRHLGAQLVEHEVAALPWLASHLPLPLPEPRHVGGPDPRLPARFFAYRRLHGRSSDRVAPVAARGALVPTLAGFLGALHGLDADAALAAGVPRDSFRGDVARSLQTARRHLDAMAGRPRFAELYTLLDELWHRLANPTPAAATTQHVLHGDLHARHLLLDDAPLRITGVIDWGDVCVGDAAVDLRIAWLWLAPDDRRRLIATLAPAYDADVWHRARVHALKVAVALLSWADDIGDDPMLAEATAAATSLATD